jgi:acetyl-CoA carboxylase biotin carboxyl carrier protein
VREIMAIIDVKSDITGHVWRIVANPGDRIAAEEPIVIVESMKMEIPVSPSEDGTVREVLVSKGDLVTEGSIVARVEV